MKTLAIRLDDELHAQLQVLAQLSETSLADVIKTAIESHVETRRHDPKLAAQAEGVLADIDRAAATRRDAIASMFAESAKSGEPAANAGDEVANARGRNRKPAG